MNGKREEVADSRRKAADEVLSGISNSMWSTRRVASARSLRSAPTSLLARGFTLLELMIVISIIVILALIVLPQYNKSVLAAREAVLRDNLFQMRKMIDQYAADKQKLPQDLSELVSAGYLHEIPVDPMTGERNWVPMLGDDPNSVDSTQGLINVCSAAQDESSDGTSYSDCDAW